MTRENAGPVLIWPFFFLIWSPVNNLNLGLGGGQWFTTSSADHGPERLVIGLPRQLGPLQTWGKDALKVRGKSGDEHLFGINSLSFTTWTYVPVQT